MQHFACCSDCDVGLAVRCTSYIYVALHSIKVLCETWRDQKIGAYNDNLASHLSFHLPPKPFLLAKIVLASLNIHIYPSNKFPRS